MGRKRHATGPPDSEASYEGQGDPLLMALFEGDQEGARRILDKGECNIEAADQLGWRPLHRAAFGGLAVALASLLERRADPGAVDNDGLQPLHVAASGGHEECCRLLVAAGADPTAPDGYSGMSAQLYTLVQEPAVAQRLQQVLGCPDLAAWACHGDPVSIARHTASLDVGGASKDLEAHWATELAIAEGEDEDGELDDEAPVASEARGPPAGAVAAEAPEAKAKPQPGQEAGSSCGKPAREEE